MLCRHYVMCLLKSNVANVWGCFFNCLSLTFNMKFNNLGKCSTKYEVPDLPLHFSWEMYHWVSESLLNGSQCRFDMQTFLYCILKKIIKLSATHLFIHLWPVLLVQFKNDADAYQNIFLILNLRRIKQHLRYIFPFHLHKLINFLIPDVF